MNDLSQSLAHRPIVLVWIKRSLQTIGVAAALILALALLVETPFAPNARALSFEPKPAPGLSTAAPAATGPAVVSALPWLPPTPAYRILIDADGLYSLSYSYLQNAGLPVDTLDPRSLRMYRMGKEIAISVVGEGDGRFDPGDLVLFYGRSVDSLFYEGMTPANKYTGDNVYWLVYGGANGLRMVEKDGSPAGTPPAPFPHTDHVEKNRNYQSAYPFQHDADHWFGDLIIAPAGGVGSRSYDFNITNLATGVYTGALKVSILGYANNLHHLRLYMNGNKVLDGSPGWQYFNAFMAVADVPQAFFKEGKNTVKIELTNAGSTTDQAYVNWFEPTYYDSYVAENNRLAFGNPKAGTWNYSVSNFATNDIEIYDITDIDAVQRLINGVVTGAGPFAIGFGDSVVLASATNASSRYHILTTSARLTPKSIASVTYPTSLYSPADLLDASNRADYLIITHKDFWAQAVQLADYRAASYSVALIDVQQIYDQFNGGVMSAESIRDFLGYALANWALPAPGFVVLMGDGTSDMRNYKGGSAPTFVPPYLYLADPDLGETAAENRFVLLAGNDLMPDMHLGRLPVNTTAEAQAMVDKIIAYETQCNCGPWGDHLLFISDDLEGGGGDFYGLSDGVADGYLDAANTIPVIPSAYSITKAYLGQTCDTVGEPSPANGCRAEITGTLNTTGSLFVSYVGHAGTDYWATERLMDQVMINSLTNGPCLPIMLAMTCKEGLFTEPAAGFQALAEASTRRPVHGAIASFSPTGFGLADGHDFLEKGLFEALFYNGVTELGVATDMGKLYLLTNAPPGKFRDLLDTFILIGDPGLHVKTQEYCRTLEAGARLGNLIWWDIDGDGRQDAGEPGIPGVDVVLGGPLTMTATTDANGAYLFQNLVAGTYSLTIASYEFAPGGALEGWLPSPKDNAADDLDSDGDAITKQASATLLPGQNNQTVDFGFNRPSSFVLTKKLNTPEPVRPDAAISFTIRITNTGDTWISTLPLRDVYDANIISYGSLGRFATPVSNDNGNDGQIDWSDLTTTFGDLGPGASVSVDVWFTTRQDITSDVTTENRAIVEGALADADGPGPLAVLAALPRAEAPDTVMVTRPTGLDVFGFRAAAESEGVRLIWQTASETGVLGFNLLRSEQGAAQSQATKLNPSLIFAAQSGANAGGAYQWLDATASAQSSYLYHLEIVHLDGSVSLPPPVATRSPALSPGRLFTPLILRRR